MHKVVIIQNYQDARRLLSVMLQSHINAVLQLGEFGWEVWYEEKN